MIVTLESNIIVTLQSNTLYIVTLESNIIVTLQSNTLLLEMFFKINMSFIFENMNTALLFKVTFQFIFYFFIHLILYVFFLPTNESFVHSKMDRFRIKYIFSSTNRNVIS